VTLFVYISFQPLEVPSSEDLSLFILRVTFTLLVSEPHTATYTYLLLRKEFISPGYLQHVYLFHRVDVPPMFIATCSLGKCVSVEQHLSA